MAKILSVLVGVAYRKAFRILDNAGEIFDDLLYNNKSFTPEYFPQIEYSGFLKGLKNPKTGNYLHLLADNIVYSHSISSQDKKDLEIKEVLRRVEKGIVPVLIEKYRLDISRIGIVYTVEVTSEMLEKFKKKYFKDNVDVSSFRFSISEGTPEGIRKKEVQDYYNTIYSISRTQSGFVISFDFQEYFSPMRPSWSDCGTARFFEKAQKEFEEKLLAELE